MVFGSNVILCHRMQEIILKWLLYNMKNLFKSNALNETNMSSRNDSVYIKLLQSTSYKWLFWEKYI